MDMVITHTHHVHNFFTFKLISRALKGGCVYGIQRATEILREQGADEFNIEERGVIEVSLLPQIYLISEDVVSFSLFFSSCSNAFLTPAPL